MSFERFDVNKFNREMEQLDDGKRKLDAAIRRVAEAWRKKQIDLVEEALDFHGVPPDEIFKRCRWEKYNYSLDECIFIDGKKVLTFSGIMWIAHYKQEVDLSWRPREYGANGESS